MAEFVNLQMERMLPVSYLSKKRGKSMYYIFNQTNSR